MTQRIEFEDYVVEYSDDDETKQRVFDRVMAFFRKHEAFHGETICQCDRPMIDAPGVLADIADEAIGFKVTYTD